MYRNICSMLLVLFAVNPALPASQGEGRLGSERVDCLLALSKGANILCEFFGYSYFHVLDHETGELGCDDGTKRVKLPEYVWPLGSTMSSCDPKLKKTLKEFSDEMVKIKDVLKNRGCNFD